MKKVFVNGNHGTTGLRICERLEKYKDIELKLISDDLRKDPVEIKKYINESDISVLCLPDQASIEAVAMVDNPDVCIVDTSTAHRTNPEWAYGFPELSLAHRNKIKNSKRVAVPGCHATGFTALIYPLIKLGIMSQDYPVSSFSLTGYSGGGKTMIAEYESETRNNELSSPRQYGVSQNHKHLKEMQNVCALGKTPLFSPIVADFYSGMIVSIPIYADMLEKKISLEDLRKLYRDYYIKQHLIQVMPSDYSNNGFIASNGLSGKDNMEILINGNDDRIVLSARFDNLGKGASGAAVQCINIMLGLNENTGLLV